MSEYARLSQTYDTKWSFYIEATTRETVARLALRPNDRLLDVGCGTGALLAHLSAVHPAAQLTGADPVPQMLAIARGKLCPTVELREGWAEKLPFAAAHFDIVVSCNMFHYIGRPLDTLREIRRVLRPDGRLVITDWCGDYAACRLVDWYQRAVNHSHIKVYRRRELVRLAQAADYTVESIACYKINWLWGLMTAQLHFDPV